VIGGFFVTLGDCHHLDGLEVVVSVVKPVRRLCGALEKRL
jgi:hypothetical protein